MPPDLAVMNAANLCPASRPALEPAAQVRVGSAMTSLDSSLWRSQNGRCRGRLHVPIARKQFIIDRYDRLFFVVSQLQVSFTSSAATCSTSWSIRTPSLRRPAHLRRPARGLRVPGAVRGG